MQFFSELQQTSSSNQNTVNKLRGLGLLECLNPITTPLLFVCKLNKQGIAKQLIDANADVNAVTQGEEAQSCLHVVAAIEGSILSHLLSAGANVNYCDNHGRTALSIACKCGIYENVRDLLYAGADPNIGEYSCLYYSTKFESPPIINDILMQYKASGKGVISLSLAKLGLTKITRDEEYWKTFEQLQEIDLKDNNLNFIPIAIAYLPNLKYVYLDGNPLTAIPESNRDVYWSQKLKNYLLSVQQVSEDFLERKIILFGPNGAGKSNLLSSINGKYKTNKLQADSLNVEENFNLVNSSWFSLIESSKFSKFQYTSWDFEGHLFPSHRFFLTSQAIYLIVFNLADPDFKQIEYWMNLLKSLSHIRVISPILLVGTHIDSPLCKDREYCQNILLKFKKQYPRQIYPGMRGIYLVSNKTNEGITELKSKIIEISKNIKISVPPSWISFQKLLKCEKENFISWGVFKKIADQFSIENECEMKQVLEFLQDTGSILYFDDNRSNLRDIVILNPKWLSGVMTSFYKDNTTNGILDIQQVPTILKDYPMFLHDTLFSLMEKFEIIIRIPNSTRILIPSLLPPDTPKPLLKIEPISSILTISQGIWSINYPPQTIEHARIYEFSFLPVGLFDKVLSGSFFLKKGISHISFWRNGILLSLQSDLSCCLVKCSHIRQNKSEKLVYILSIHARMPKARFIRGKPNILLNEMIKLVEHIIDSYYFQMSNEIKRFIPCPHCTKSGNKFTEPFLFPFNECVHKLAENEPIVYCNNFKVPQRAVLISYLAPDITFRGFTILSDKSLGNKDDWKYIAEGGFGKVWKAYYEGNPVAVKELHNSESEILNNFVEFQKEVQIMSVLRHENTVGMIGISRNPLRIVTEFVGGGDLHRLLRPKNKCNNFLPLQLQYRIAYDIAQGMNYLQSFNPPIVHRDLRSPNIFIVSEDPNANVCAKVADFGLSAFVVKNVGGALRTWQWLAPEVIDFDSSSYSELSDIYSYAIVLWEIVTTEMPFYEYYQNPKYSRCKERSNGEIEYITNIHAIQNAIIHDNLRPTIPDSCPPIFKEIINACWHTNAENRYPFHSIIQLLESFVSNKKPNLGVQRKSISFSPKTPDVESSEELEFLVLKKIKSNDNIQIPDPQKIEIESEIFSLLVIEQRLWIVTETEFKLLALSSVHDNVLSSMDIIISFNHEHNRVYSIIKLQNSPKVCSAGGQGKIQFWSSNTGKFLYKKEYKYMISSLIEISTNGNNYIWASVPELNTIYRINSENYTELKPISLGEFPCYSMITHNDVIFVGSQGVIIILDFNGDILGTWEAHETLPIKFLVSNSPVLWTCASNQICIWDVCPPKTLDDQFEIKPVSSVSTHDSRLTAMELLNIKKNNLGECRKEIWTSSYDYIVLTWSFESNSFEPYFEIKLPEKEFIRSFAQYNNIVFMGSSIVHKSDKTTNGNLYIYNFNKV